MPLVRWFWCGVLFALSACSGDKAPGLRTDVAYGPPGDTSGLERFDHAVIEAHEEYNVATEIGWFHLTTSTLCWNEREPWFDELPDNEQRAHEQIFSSCSNLQPLVPSEPTNAESWDEMIGARWETVTWWDTQDAFAKLALEACETRAAGEIATDVFRQGSASAAHHVIAILSHDECPT